MRPQLIKRKRLRKIQKTTLQPTSTEFPDSTTFESSTFAAVTGSTYRPVKRIRVRSKLSKGKPFENNGTVTVRKLRKQSKLKSSFATTTVESDDSTTTTVEPELVTASDEQVALLRNRESSSTRRTTFPSFLAVSKGSVDGKGKMKILVKVKDSGSGEVKSDEETATKSPDYDYAYYDTDEETQIAQETVNHGSGEDILFGKKAESS